MSNLINFFNKVLTFLSLNVNIGTMMTFNNIIFVTVNSQQSTVNSQQSTVNSQQSTVNSQQSTFKFYS